MTDKMREALVAALSKHSSEGQFKLAAIAFFELARQEGMVLDDFLSLKKLAPPRPAGALLTNAMLNELEASRTCLKPPLKAEFDWRKQAEWLNHVPGSTRRQEHQIKFRNTQGHKTRAGTLPDSMEMEEAVQHYFYFGKHEGLYMVEAPASYLNWLLDNASGLAPRARQVINFILDQRDQGELPEPVDPFDGEVDWLPLTEL